jgi:hypothetical protein
MDKERETRLYQQRTLYLQVHDWHV